MVKLLKFFNNNIYNQSYNSNMHRSNIKNAIKRRSLTPTANPLQRINASLKKYSIDLSSSKQDLTYSSELTPYLKNPLHLHSSNDNYFTLIQKQSKKYESVTEASQGTSKVTFINEKIDSILSNYKENSFRKETKCKLKPKRITEKQNICRVPKALKKQKQNVVNPPINIRKKLQSFDYQQKPRITLKDITIQNISYNPWKQNSSQSKIDKSSFNGHFPQQITPKNKFARQNVGNEEHSYSNSLKSNIQKCNIRSPFSLQSDLEQLKKTTNNIDSILLNLQNDFIKNQESRNVYVNQNIRVPKIFRKSKRRQFQQTNSTKSEQKNQPHNCIFKNQNQKLTNKSMIILKKHQSGEILKLMNALNKQIELDNKFKRIKYWFKKLKSQSKWKSLENTLRKSQLWINELSMKTIFLLENEEQNPFESIRQDQYTIKDLIKALKAAEQHWNNQICNIFDAKSLTAEGLIEQTIDVGHRGYIAIQDLIRFINCQLKHYYCNRDINLIYIRLKGSEKLSFNQFLNKISKEHS